MTQIYQNLDKKLPALEVPAGLLEKVILRVDQERRVAQIKRRLLLFMFIFILSGSTAIPVFTYIKNELIRTGFSDYLSLLYYDYQIVAVYWQDFLLTILETLPALGLSAILVISASLIASGRQIYLNFINLKNISHYKTI